ncbi:MAG: acyltransferase [Lachnospiraceae bacterium]|nr:acyltransferase [Lachnospiraceae bacterium]MBD5395954.1 acyltransferase [Lachnospiraceae bacterium]
MAANEKFEKNGFDILRYMAALSVMMLHYSGYTMILSTNLSEQAANIMNGIRHLALLFPGVVILFTMSGFLISASFERAGTRKEFFLRRVLRMYPELWICTIVNLAVVCILVPELLDGSMILWVGTQVFGIANTPDCLKTFATGSVNGALWTVFTEVQLYIVLGIVYPFLKKLKDKHWAILLMLLAVLNLILGIWDTGGIISKLIERIFLPYAMWFFIGVFCYQRRQEILPVLKKAFLPMLIIYLIIESLNVEIPGYYADIATSILVPFMVIGAGYCLPKIRLKTDLTYGMFLYHWIILNIIVHYDLMNKLPWYAGMLLFLTGTVIAAAASRKLYCKLAIKFRAIVPKQ